MALEFEQEEKVMTQEELKWGTGTEPEENEEKQAADSPLEEGDNKDDEEEEVDPFETDLFGNPINEGKPKKVKAAAPSTNATKPKKEDKLYDTEWLIFYAGHRLTVPEDGLLLDQVRGYLELEFPELSKERTEMLTDNDKKHIIPVVKGAKKG